MQLYIADHDARYPDSKRWASSLLNERYAKSIDPFRECGQPQAAQYCFGFNRILSVQPVAGLEDRRVLLTEIDTEVMDAELRNPDQLASNRHDGLLATLSADTNEVQILTITEVKRRLRKP